ncbi:Similar to MED18: Mediator of RNA polymerase II transcription subunit 18 (Aedes aegypti) [Cotesia congregata]|uniref:Mediator of RNA polymerase II transcription subunit 18 n=1 Tax=Cotesia congregata TaxID=51543 RepID=A0A8J2HJH5_COTCN|nr:Similar to MED18: Mediator of RNA polymerase II transcription subunit 18 (Aedes aegypti) [Cotesia congregata]
MASAISSAVDSLHSAIQSNIIPNQEYLLQGSVLDTAVEVLLHRLRGFGPTDPPVSLRVRRAIDYPDMPFQLRYIGQPELGDKSRAAVVRSSIDVGTSNTVIEFLTEMGCRLDFEYIIRGYMFRKGRMKITVSKIFKMPQGKVMDSMEAISSSYLVELSVLAPRGQDAIAEDMRVFAEQLKPLVQLEKIDYNRLCKLIRPIF